MPDQLPVMLHYEISGKGPVVVLLHGYMMSLNYWDIVRAELSEDHTVIAIDLLGFGASPKPKHAAYDYDDQLIAISQIVTSLHLSDPFTMIGHSMGALIAVRFATVYPHMVRSLCLLNIPLFVDAVEARRDLAGTNFFYKMSLYYGVHAIICPVFRTTPLQLLMRASLPKMYSDRATYFFSNSARSRVGSLHNIIENQNSIEDINALNIPIRIVLGTKDRKRYLQNAARINDRPNITVELVKTGHHTIFENTALALTTLRTSLS
jgi:pimeloyl-ACP methyl ester carboxylesterase